MSRLGANELGASDLGVTLVGDGMPVPCVDGSQRPYLSLDAAASTAALPAVAERVNGALEWYSSVHRGAGYKSQQATAAYEDARRAVLDFAGRSGRDDIAIFCRNTTEAINHLAYRLALDPSDVVVTTVVEHHANLLPWSRVATRRFVECGRQGTFTLEDVVAALDEPPLPRLLAFTGASNVTGWVPPADAIVAAAHDRGVPVLVDAAQLAPHRLLPAGADFLVFSGHKMYAPFGAGTLIGPRGAFEHGDPFLAGGGAVEMVDLDEVVWSEPPERDEAGSPNVLGAVAFGAAAAELAGIGWKAIAEHDLELSGALRAAIRSVGSRARILGPADTVAAGAGVEPADLLPVVTFVIDGIPQGLVAARLSAEHGIGVRHGCFCAHPYLIRLLGLSEAEIAAYKDAARRGDRASLPGAVRVSAGLSTTLADVERFRSALEAIVSGAPAPVGYVTDAAGEYWPEGFDRPDSGLAPVPGCARA